MGPPQGYGRAFHSIWSILLGEVFTLSRIQFLAVLLALGAATGCKAQSTVQPVSSQEQVMNRRIEILVRSQFNIPKDYTVTIGTRTPSKITGYDTLPITFSRDEKKKQVVDFLISTDGTKLGRLETYDLSKDPASAIDVSNRPIRGNPAAKVTVVSYDDLECAYCGVMHKELFPDTIDRYKDKVRFIYKDFPLVEIHPWAMHAAIAANCLAAQNATVYWNFVDYVHAHGDEVNGTDRSSAKGIDTLNRIARQEAALGKLDESKLNACLTVSDETQVRASMKEAQALNVDGTPAMFVNGERIEGALPKAEVWAVIDRALRAEGIEPPATPAATPAVAVAK
jgi:protein-disulfide isomerase